MHTMSDSIPGFRFYPTEDELISFYLQNKLEGLLEDVIDLVIPILNVYDFNPSHLSQYSGAKCRGDAEQSFFFIPRQESEVRGGRPSRLTETGYWKATGSPSSIYSLNNRIIGQKRTMVFYVGRAPQGQKTQWKMNEYKAIQGDATSSTAATPPLRQEFSLCRVYKKTKCLRAFDRRPTGADNIVFDENPTNEFNQQNNGNQGDHHDRREVEAPILATYHQSIASQDDQSLRGSFGGPSMTTVSDDRCLQISAEDEVFDMSFWDNL